MTEWYLVWIDGPRGPEPQKWSSEGLWGQLGRQDVIVRFPLTDQEAKLSLDRLAREHPVPGGDPLLDRPVSRAGLALGKTLHEFSAGAIALFHGRSADGARLA